MDKRVGPMAVLILGVTALLIVLAVLWWRRGTTRIRILLRLLGLITFEIESERDVPK